MSSRNPAVIIYDSTGTNPVAVLNDGGVYRLRTETTVSESALPDGAATEATVATLATEAKLEAVRALVQSISNEDFATEATLSAIGVLLTSLEAKDFATEATLDSLLTAFNNEDFATQTTLAAIQSLLTTIDGVLDNIYARQADKSQFTKITDGTNDAAVDASGDLQVIHTDPLPAGINEIGKVAQGTKAAAADAWPTVQVDSVGNPVTVVNDAGVYREAIIGKVTVVGAAPPPSTTEATIFANSPLVVGSSDTAYVIPNGQVFHLQGIIAGNEDPTKGASVEIIFDNAGTERLIRRIYLAGFSVEFGFPDVNESQDGNSLVGNGAGTNRIIIRRSKFSGTNIAINAVVSGYVV